MQLLDRGIVPLASVDRIEHDVPAEPEARVAGIDREVGGFEDDREVGRLLDLEDEDARTDRVGRRRRDEPDVAGDGRPMDHRLEERGRLLLLDPSTQLVAPDSAPEPKPDVGWRSARNGPGPENDPRLGL